jgi:L-ascorbate metabolism protein UlaG (beta-lactamase superfamily)
VQIPCRWMHLRLIRNATLRLELGGRRLLVDPMLDPAGARPPVENTENDRRNPLVELPEPAEVVIEGIDAVLVTHMHSDHFDDTAARLLPKDVPVLCQPEDADRLRGHGFTDVRPVEATARFDGLDLTRTPARHGSGETAELMAPVSGFVLRDGEGRTLYLAGDTVLYDAVEAVLDEHRPDVVVVNASGARFAGGDPIVMDADDVVAVARRAAGARVVAVHLEAVNHCVETRADLHQRLHEEGLTHRVTVPEDGAAVPVD